MLSIGGAGLALWCLSDQSLIVHSSGVRGKAPAGGKIGVTQDNARNMVAAMDLLPWPGSVSCC